MKKRTGVIAAAILAVLILVVGCDVRVLYPPFDDGYVVEDPTLLSVLSPDAEDTYHPGDYVSIAWEGSVASETVSIGLYRYGQPAGEIATDVPNSGYFDWSIPADFDAVSEIVDQYQIAVRAKHPDYISGELYLEARSEMFTIIPAATGGLSDVTVSQATITITVTDNGTEIDGDTIDILLNGSPVVTSHVLLAAPGTDFELVLQAGTNELEIVAINEGTVSPNTAELAISDVVEGEPVQDWRLSTGESGSLTITAP